MNKYELDHVHTIDFTEDEEKSLGYSTLNEASRYSRLFEDVMIDGRSMLDGFPRGHKIA